MHYKIVDNDFLCSVSDCHSSQHILRSEGTNKEAMGWNAFNHDDFFPYPIGVKNVRLHIMHCIYGV